MSIESNIESNKKWADQFRPKIKRHFGELILSDGKEGMDLFRSTDLFVLRRGDLQIACRVRRDQYRLEYGDEFTISSGNSGNVQNSELEKIIEGQYRFFFYGFANETQLTQWFIGDLDRFCN